MITAVVKGPKCVNQIIALSIDISSCWMALGIDILWLCHISYVTYEFQSAVSSGQPVVGLVRPPTMRQGKFYQLMLVVRELVVWATLIAGSRVLYHIRVVLTQILLVNKLKPLLLVGHFFVCLRGCQLLCETRWQLCILTMH